jgi:SAM-dependent methyltransferase
MMRKRAPKVLPEKDLKVFREAGEDLLDYLYGGLAGRFQIVGHKMIDHWAKPYVNRMVLEIGCGHGHHLLYGSNQYTQYIGLDIERKFLQTLKDRFPGKMMINDDAYALPFRNASVDCVLSIYNFGHLRHLAESLSEIGRVLKSNGELLLGIPAEGGFVYGLGRWLTSKCYMERKYGIDYDAIVRWDHWNTFNELIEALRIQFGIESMSFIPFSFLPIVHINVIGCMRARLK